LGVAGEGEVVGVIEIGEGGGEEGAGLEGFQEAWW
jgi:hypothetical protein